LSPHPCSGDQGEDGGHAYHQAECLRVQHCAQQRQPGRAGLGGSYSHGLLLLPRFAPAVGTISVFMMDAGTCLAMVLDV
jgi:hypothetical protein